MVSVDNSELLQQQGHVGTNIQFQYANSGKHLNTEELRKATWADICVSKNKWVTHACQTPGCAEGYVTIDGNEYLKRSKCALPMEKVKIRRDLPEIYKCCPNSPLPGGKSQKPSKLCADHQSHVETTAEVSVPPEYNTASTEAGLMREDVCLSQQGQTGCKRKQNISLFFQSTAGMLALINLAG